MPHDDPRRPHADDHAPDAAPPPRDGRRAWLALAVLALPALIVSLDLSVLLLALPRIGADLGASATEQLWITDAYGFMVAGFLVTMGTLGDRIGRRRLLLGGAAAFGVGSVAAAWAPSTEALIAARALLGVAGATLMPSTLALVGAVFADERRRATAIGLVFSCIMVGGALGQVVGGLLLSAFWWGSVFLLAVPVMALLLVAGPRLLPERRDPGAGLPDLPSVGLSLLALLPLVWALKHVAAYGLSLAVLGAVALGAVAGVAFVRRQGRLSSPLLDLGLFRVRRLGVLLGWMLGGGVVLGGVQLLVVQDLQLVEGRTPLQAGLALLPSSVAMIVGILAGPAVARRTSPAAVVSGGTALAALGLAALALAADGPGSLVPVVAALAVAMLGLGLPGGLAIALIMAAAPPERAGSAASLSETSQELGLSLGFALLGSLGAVAYRGAVEGRLPDALPADAAARAAGMAPGALDVAGRSPGALGAEVVGAAQAATATGLQVVAAVGAAVLLLASVAVALGLRERAGEPEPARARDAVAA